MVDNNVGNIPSLKDAIERAAYFKWESDDRYHGRALHHWLAAERDVLARIATSIGQFGITPNLIPEPDSDDLEVLAQIAVDFFTANPAEIEAFDKSTLSWSVSGPEDRRFAVLLDRSPVTARGSIEVRPSSTRAFTLFAKVGLFERRLQTVVVKVSLGTCREDPFLFDIERLLETLLTIKVDKAQNLSFRKKLGDGVGPLVQVTSSGIRIQMALEKKVEDFPNPRVDVSVDLFRSELNFLPLLFATR